MSWRVSHRASPNALELADRHYNRQKVGTPQFVPPGRCLVLLHDSPALWVTSWPFAQYCKHEWAGAWVNSLFRNEGQELSSRLIREAVSCTRFRWPAVPDLGIVSFVDPHKVPGVRRRGQAVYGYCYLKAGFRHVGYTQGGLWAWQMLPDEMPEPAPAFGSQLTFA
jgi:hypothetical protein